MTTLENALRQHTATAAELFMGTKKTDDAPAAPEKPEPKILDVKDLGAVSGSDRPEITMVLWDHIRVNPDNFYAVNDVDDLANSIEMHGLLDPVVVTPEPDEGWYLLISGHRRHKAWGQLREKDPEKYAEIPAIVRTFESSAMAELALIMANSSARVLTSPEISRQAERVERLLYDLKAEGYEFPGRMRDQVAKACQVSSTKLARLKVIRDKLAAPWQRRWTENKLPEDTAYKLAQLPDWIQERIFTVNPTPMARGVEKVGELMEAGNDYRCADLTAPGCGRCSHGDAFLRHDLEDPWNTCEGKTCCLKCPKATRDWAPCSRMCSKAKAKKAAANAKEKEKQAAEAARKESRLRGEIRESALRLLKAADAAGAGDDVKISRNSWSYKTVGWLRKAAGDGDIGTIYENALLPENLDVAAVAKALSCSADYVCGLTEELHPAPAMQWAAPVHADPELVDAELVIPEVTGDVDAPAPVVAQGSATWLRGTPIVAGRYLCTVSTEDGLLLEQACDWRDGGWLCYGRDLADLFTVECWWPLPPRMEYHCQTEEDDNGED